MVDQDQKIHAVPTNIITGFLGVGKTTAILHLLKSKPASERWAVLVNEFGEIGVDGSLVEGQFGEDQGVYTKEVPGGCMCCAAGLPMQIALNQLLTRAKPDRLLIEPTGLGHPVEVLQVLSAEHYQGVLDIQKVVALVDARKLTDERYTSNEIFNQQLSIADVVVGNKVDLYQDGDKTNLQNYVQFLGGPDTELVFADHGNLSFDSLFGKTASQVHGHMHGGNPKPLLSEAPIPESGFLRAENKGEGFKSVGWRFAPTKIFDRQKLHKILASLSAERMKAVFITEDGVFGYNLTTDALSEMELDDCVESRIEIIASEIKDDFEKMLLACLV